MVSRPLTHFDLIVVHSLPPFTSPYHSHVRLYSGTNRGITSVRVRPVLLVLRIQGLPLPNRSLHCCRQEKLFPVRLWLHTARLLVRVRSPVLWSHTNSALATRLGYARLRRVKISHIETTPIILGTLISSATGSLLRL